MTKEAINKLQQIIDEHRTEAFITCPETCWCWDVEGVMLSLELSLPPAEGAEAYMKLYFQKKYSGAPPVTLTKPECIELMTMFAAQQQPTAEGADEILDEEKILLLFNKHSNCLGKSPIKMPCMTRSAFVSAVKEFATLHAQKIADKMVSESKELIIGDYLEWFYTQTEPINHSINTIKMFLKSRER